MMTNAKEEAGRLKKEFWEDIAREQDASIEKARVSSALESLYAPRADAGAKSAGVENPLRGAVLDEARAIINGERQDAYGNPEDCFKDIAFLWKWWLGIMMTTCGGSAPMKPSDVAMMMALLKIAREVHNHKRDNIVDACGYLGLYNDMIDGCGAK